MLALGARPAKAQQLDKTLHFTGAYAATLTFYLMYRKLDMPKVPAYLMSFATTNLIGVVKEYAIDANPDPADLLHNGIGSATAIGFTMFFDF